MTRMLYRVPQWETSKCACTHSSKNGSIAVGAGTPSGVFASSGQRTPLAQQCTAVSPRNQTKKEVGGFSGGGFQYGCSHDSFLHQQWHVCSRSSRSCFQPLKRRSTTEYACGVSAMRLREPQHGLLGGRCVVNAVRVPSDILSHPVFHPNCGRRASKESQRQEGGWGETPAADHAAQHRGADNVPKQAVDVPREVLRLARRNSGGRYCPSEGHTPKEVRAISAAVALSTQGRS